jgi:hypothetical protein
MQIPIPCCHIIFHQNYSYHAATSFSTKNYSSVETVPSDILFLCASRNYTAEATDIVKWRLKTKIAEQEQVVGTRQGHGKHVSTPMNKHATIEELLEVVFCTWSMPRLHSMNPAAEKSWSWISWRLKPGMTMLAKASSNLTDRPRQSQVVLLAATT